MTPRLLAMAAAALALSTSLAQAAEPTGDWLTQDKLAVVRISTCGGKVCGVVQWLKRPTDKVTGQPRKDDLNPDPALRQRPLLGLPMLQGFSSDAPDHWSGGTIYDPDSGKTYQSKMTVQADGDLKVEGCVLVFCKSQIWTPAPAH